jgi:Uma2 family endonuclease
LVCAKSKITENNIQGPPDLIVEVVSKGTEVKDRREKKNLYERFGVKEYILVFPEREYVERYCLEEGKFGSPEIINWDEILRLTVFEFEINLWEIFEKEKPKPAKPEPN